jgi:hypothetical protein
MRLAGSSIRILSYTNDAPASFIFQRCSIFKLFATQLHPSRRHIRILYKCLQQHKRLYK